MTLRRAILVSVLTLVLATVAATMFVVHRVVKSAAVRSVREGVDLGRSAFAGQAARRRAELRDLSAVVADEPRLKAVAAGDVDRTTIVEVAREVHVAMGTDVFVLVDSAGRLIVDMLAPEHQGEDMLGNKVVAGALERGSATGVWADDHAVYEVRAQVFGFADRILGAVVLGRVVDDSAAAVMHGRLGGSIVVLLDGAAVAVSPLPGAGMLDRAELGQVLATVKPGAGAVEVRLGQARFLAAADRYPGYRGKADVRFVVLRNLDLALQPSRRVAYLLYGILGIAAVAAVFLALFLSRRLSQPLRDLCALTERIARGELDARARAGGYAEVATLARAMNHMAAELHESRAHRSEKERLESEFAIATRIQTSILPGPVSLPGLEIAARMETASEVGGDYYDILPVAGGGWLGIGDVAGHGLNAGLIMLMAQTAIATLVAAEPEATPAQLAVALNRVLHANIKDRMGSDRYMTLCLMRYMQTGRVLVAGAHLEILYLPADEDDCTLLETPGMWMGMLDDVEPMLVDTEYRLAPGDLMVLYTDGLIEARDAGGEMFGLDRVMALVVAARARPASEICAALYQAAAGWAEAREDDITVLVMRYQGEPD